MFNKCSVFNQDLSSWTVSNVTDMFAMFQLVACSVFNQDLSSWDVSNVVGMSGMFNEPVVYLIKIYRVGM